MKKFILVLLQIVGLFLFYGALGIMLRWGFGFNLPFPSNLKNNEFFPKGVFILLPIIGFLSIRFGVEKIFKTLGYLYIIGWIIVIIRTLVILFGK